MSYTDFIGETIAESYRTGKLRKPNKNNAVSKSRSSFREKLMEEAEQQNKDIDEVALDYVENNSAQIQKYILSRGEVPNDENPVSLAVQAWNLRNKEISDLATAMDTDFDTAESFIDEAENRALEISSPEADSFLGEIVDALGRVAGKGLRKISQKRQAKGKKPGAAGFVASLFPQDEQNPEAELSIKDLLSKAYSDIKKRETKSAVREYMPLIITALVAIVLVTFFIAKRK